MLAGEEGYRIESVRIECPQWTYIIKDAASIDYLNRALKTASKDGYVPSHDAGSTFVAHVQLSGGDQVIFACDSPDNANGWNLAYPWVTFMGDDPTYYWVPLPLPRPEGISAALAQIRKPE
jgi:hypothetical protein